MLEFYQEATKILATKVKARTMRMVLKGSELPQIIDKFAENCEHLHKLVGSVIGDNTNYIKDTAIDQRVNMLLGGEIWHRQNEHYAQLQDLRADGACEFLLQTELFRKWRDQSVSQKLLLLGDMGSGKSVTMSWVVRHLEQTNEPQIPHPKVCWYYCRYPETDRVSQILRILLLSLLKQMKGLQSGFLESYDDAAGSFDPVQNVSALRGFLHDALEAANRPVFIVIDGLDECSLEARNDLLELLEHLAQKFPGLKMMFSSRPERDVKDQLGEMDSIQLELSLRRDEIIAQKSVDKQLPHLQPSVKALIVEKLSHLAEGSGIWTRMVVQLIQVRRIRTREAVEKFFKDVDTILPKDLSSLYVELYFRYTLEDSTNEELASTALKALASARRPLSISELAWAVGLSTDPEVTTVEALGDPVDGETFMDLIRPFVLQVDSTDLKKHQVRLSHQSVNDFVLERWALFPHLRGLVPSKHDPRDLDPRFGKANEFMLNLCIRYLLLAEIDRRPLLEPLESAISELPGFVYGSSDSDDGEEDSDSQDESGDDINCFDPADRGFGQFFIYASCYWLIHLETVTKEYLPDLCHVERLCKKNSLRLKNWVEQRARPNCTLKDQSHLFQGPLDPLRIVLTNSSQDMLCHLLEKSDFDPNIFLGNAAMNAFSRLGYWGISSDLDISKVVILFENDRVGPQLQNSEFFGYVMSFSPSPFRFNQLVVDWDPVFDLVNKTSTTMIQQGWGNELICEAAKRGCLPIIQRLIEKAHTDPNLHDELLRPSITEPHHAIQRAILTNQLHIVEYLLNDNPKVHLGCRNSLGGNVLHTASKKCIHEMFRILVPRFREGMYQLDKQGDTPLMAIIKSPAGSLERFDCAQILFQHHEANGAGDLWIETHNPLAVALQDDDLDMCCLLIHAGKIDPVVALGDGKVQADSRQSNVVVEKSLLHVLGKLFGINPALSKSDPEAFRRFAKEHVQRRMDEPRPVETRYLWDTS
ncbi:unnamed protein product [Penicillium salamii]|nr:unnamed protein product [Penicillium salamii]